MYGYIPSSLGKMENNKDFPFFKPRLNLRGGGGVSPKYP